MKKLALKKRRILIILWILICLIQINNDCFAQSPSVFWHRSGNTAGGNDFGTFFTAPIDVFTSGTQIAQFTTGGGLGGSTIITGVVPGDGLKILAGSGSTASSSLDLWTTSGNGTHIKWDGTGQISGINSRMEIWATNNGFWFNTTAGTGRYIFNTNSIEHARVSPS